MRNELLWRADQPLQSFAFGERQVNRLPIALFATALFTAQPTDAHHSYAAYESARTVTLTGTVETFAWANPHVALHVLAKDNAGGDPAEWEIVTSEPGILKRFGWKRDSIKPGDRVVAVVSPMRDGSHSGRLHTLTLLDTGQVLKTKLSGS